MKHLPLIFIAVLLSAPAFAEDGAGRDGPCKADAEKLCPGVKPGEGRIAACLREHKDVVSEACKTGIREHHMHQGDDKGSGANSK